MHALFDNDLLLERILIALREAASIARCARVCSQWQRIVSTERFWRALCHQHIDATLLEHKPVMRSWQWLYRAETMPLRPSGTGGEWPRVGFLIGENRVESGEFDDDNSLHGIGRRVYVPMPESRVSVGRFAYGGMVFGRTRYLRSGDCYEGPYVNGERAGWGLYQWNQPGDNFVGEWKGGNCHGYGVYTYPDGRRYDGLWQNHSFHQFGTYTWPDGAIYVGGWQRDMRNGVGYMKWADGARWCGQFENDHRAGIDRDPMPWSGFFRLCKVEQRAFTARWQKESAISQKIDLFMRNLEREPHHK